MSTESLSNLLQDLVQGTSLTESILTIQGLDEIAKRLQTDSEFRVQVGQIKDVWITLATIFQKDIEAGLDPAKVERIMFLFRIVRNSVAGVVKNQDNARLAKVPELIQELVSQAAHTHYGNLAYILMLRAGVQALSNLLTGNLASRDQIWKSLVVTPPSKNCDENLLSTLAAIEDETVLLSTAMLCYNCIFESRERSELLLSTKAGKKLIRQLLMESQALSGKEERKSFEMIYTLFNHLIGQDYFAELFEALASLQGDGTEEEEDGRIRYHGEDFHRDQGAEAEVPKFQELKIEEVVDEEDDRAKAQEEKMKKGKEVVSDKKAYLTAEQVTLLKMIDSRIYTHHEQQQEIFQTRQQQRSTLATAPVQHRTAADDLFHVDESEPVVSEETVAFLTAVFAKVSALTIEILKTLDQPGVGEHGVEDLANLSSGLMLLLGCFSHLSMFEDGEEGKEEEAEAARDLVPVPDWFKAQHSVMVQGGLVENAIELLRQADKSLARVTKPVQPMNTGPGASAAAATPSATISEIPAMEANASSTVLSNTSTVQGQQSFFSGLKRDIVKLIGHLAYRSRHVQDRIRDCNGLIVMLSQCNIDDANPYLREYAILAMKAVLTGNQENQALIEELQPIEAVDHPALQEAKVTSRLDAETGRPVLTQQKKTS